MKLLLSESRSVISQIINDAKKNMPYSLEKLDWLSLLNDILCNYFVSLYADIEKLINQESEKSTGGIS